MRMHVRWLTWNAVSTRANDLVTQWRELLAHHARVTDALERELQARHGLSVSEFEALQRLSEHDGSGCRLQRLLGEIHLSQSALSRLIARLESRGLVARDTCSDDRRGIVACLTEAGRERLREAEPTQHEVLRRMLSPSS